MAPLKVGEGLREPGSSCTGPSDMIVGGYVFAKRKDAWKEIEELPLMLTWFINREMSLGEW